MQGKVLVALVLAMAVATVAYLRTKGPWCGDDRCGRRQYCQINARGDRGEPRDVTCEALPEKCGFWPTCGCMDMPDGMDCDASLGYVTVELEPLR
ncbi:MAG: hypothetical protein KJO07_03380 [Deltaproteobacteria bacterium]|nr:hypothetical protein [Deltaproteobacteria bacterium]